MKTTMKRMSLVAGLACGLVLFAGNARAGVVINEILYHPSNAAVQAGENAEDLQFIELYNGGPGAADLSGWSFSQGVAYTFPGGTSLAEGATLVVAADPSFLGLRGPAIPGGVAVVQWASGDLSNSGESIQLLDASAGIVDEVTYDDAGLWPAAADGSGSSLELANPSYDKSQPLAWRASAGTSGTPGARNSRYTEGPVVMIDAPARGSVVGALTEVSITFAEPVTGVAAGDLVVDGSAATTVSCPTCIGGLGAGPWVFTGFAEPKSNPLTVTLAAGATRDVQSNAFAGDTWLYFLSVPKVVINEIHYNPASSTDDEEFVELYNADATAVDLAGWRLTEFASPGCTFPTDTILQPGAYLVCAKNPAALQGTTGYLAGFSWGLNDSLGNGGEPVALLNGSGAVVDRVVFGDAPPWPSGTGSPDGNGPSLELTNPFVDNGQGQFWKASAATDGTPGAMNSTYSDAPVVATEAPARGSIILDLPQVTVTFSEPVTGVTADDLEVNGIPALGVTGEGAGPYVFTVVTPGLGAVSVVLESGGIADLQGTPFAGESWLYFFSLPRIVINEIHYHPALSAVGAGEAPEDLQFVELFNREETAVDLSGWSMAQGFGLVFPAGSILPAGGYLVLARSGAFLSSKAAIPVGVTVLDWTGGDLANSGETLTLQDAYGNLIDQVTFDDSGDWTDGADGKGPSLELLHPDLANDAAGAWKASAGTNGTPGAVNSAYAPNPLPIVFGTLHVPAIPLGGQAVTISTHVLDEGGAPQSVTLFFRQDQDPPIAYASAPMFDDGLHGDGLAGDGRYGAIVAGLPDGQQLDFYVEASDGSGKTVAPAGHATLNKYGQPSQTYLCKFSNEVVPTDIVVYHILVTLNNKHKQEAIQTYPARKEPFDATFIDGAGNVWYNVTERYRGQSSLFKYPSSYRVDFPSNRKLMSVLGFPVESLQMNGMRPMGQWLGYNLFNRAGMPAPRVGWARLRYTGINYDTCCTGQNSYYGAHVVVERYDNDFLDSQGGAIPERGTSSEGNLYRGRNDANFRWEGTDPTTYMVGPSGQSGYEKYNNETEDFWGDLLPLCDAVSNSPADQYVPHVKAHVDEDNWARYYAIQMLLGNREGGIYRDTGDDYFIYFPPVGDPRNPVHPDFGSTELPDDRVSGKSLMLPWDLDSVIWAENETIWRTNVPAPRNFLRHNAFAPIFLQTLETLAANEFSAATMGELIDSLPDAVFARSEGSDLWPETKPQFKAWIANRIQYVLNETLDTLTLAGVPASPYESVDPVIHLSGQLQQAGTHNITVNGVPATFSVFQGTWSYDLTLALGMNRILVQAWDRAGAEKARIEKTLFYNPVGTSHLQMDLRAPRRMVGDKTLTIVAAISDPIGRVAWDHWDELGSVSVVRLPDRTPVAITDTVFDSHVPVPDDSIRFVNGWGSVSFTLDEGAAFAPGDIEVTVDWNGIRASRQVTVVQAPAFRDMVGTLTGPNLVWGPNETIRVTGNCTVPAGSTLTIHPGTLVQVNTTGTLENGTLIVVNGTVQALGTRDLPIFFFSEKGPLAMTLTQAGSASNEFAWRGFQLYGTGSSTLRHVILTGAGNGNVVSHPRPPILGLFNTHNLFVDRCAFADNGGMVFSGQGTGSYTIRKSLVSRAGIGAEFFGNGHTLMIRDSWWTGIGRAPESQGLDGDLLHVDGALSTQTIRSSILNDGGDDGIDHSNSRFAVEHSIISHVRDKSVSMTGGHVNAWNVLMFANGSGIRGTASTDYVTMNVASPIGTVDQVRTSIFWPSSIPTCTGSVDYTDVGNAADLGCGTGNLSTDPLFTDLAGHDYNPVQGSPALTAGPNQDRIGWLGFPYGSVCKTTADCDDTNACTTDVCVDKLCTFTPIVGCMPCDIDEDCDDSDPCTADTCAPDGACLHAVQPDGTACDDGKGCTSPDSCQAGACAGPENCPAGSHCDTQGACLVESVTVTFRQDVNGYTGTHDTYLYEAQPDTAEGALAFWRWDLEDPAPNREIALLRFGDIFGGAANQIPVGSTILAATLTVNVEDGGQVPAGAVSEAAVEWDEATATWNNYGGEAGVQADEVGALVGALPITAGTFTLDVTAGLQAWAAAPATNHGWIFVPLSWDGIRASSSEHATIDLRPGLTVKFAPPVAHCTVDADCDDGLFCNGVETCAPATQTCKAGTAPACDDGVVCTDDSCSESADACLHVPTDVLCDDGNLCTDDACSATLGCGHVDNIATCNDGDACTTGDACRGGACVGGPAPSCDDGVACTSDACDPATGCTHADSCPAGKVCNLLGGACEAGPTKVKFQEGVDGYTGTLDTYVSAGAPDTSNATATPLVVDGGTPPEEERQILLRFENIFGSGAGQVPPGSRIVSATLTMFVNNPSPDGALLYRVIRPWTDTDTWTTTGGGIQRDDVEAMAAEDAAGATNSNRMLYDMDVTSSVIPWSGGQANLGWVFVTPAGGTDSWQLASSEDDEIELRPMLTIEFIPCDPGYTGDGLTCFDLDECTLPTAPCDPNATCTNSIGSYSCECLPGFTGDGHECTDIDECQITPRPCSSLATCTNLPGTYTCECNAGYTGNGHSCFDIDECQQDPVPCSVDATCTNSKGSYDCTCNAGYTGDGVDCGECPGGAASPCGGHGTCGGTAIAPACECEAGFAAPDCAQCQGGLWGAACDQSCPGGVEHPCNDHGTCSEGVEGTGTCTCAGGFAGDACEGCAPGWFAYPDCTTCPDCSDGNPCTTDTCDAVTGCVHAINSLPCDDGTACTTGDTCADGTCVGTALDCADTDPCTLDSCDPVAGCGHGAIPGCCHDDSECQPPGKCLERPCDSAMHLCGWIQTPAGCCTEAADCDDGDAGTVDRCETTTGTCVNVEKCTGNEDCLDDDPCTTDTCDTGTGACLNEPVAGCCGGDGGCTGDDATSPDDVPEIPPEATDDVPTIDGVEDVPAVDGVEDVPPADSVETNEVVQDVATPDSTSPETGFEGPFGVSGGGCAAGGASGPAPILLMALLFSALLRRRVGAHRL